ncbi:MAG: hypothetical protein KGZ54_03680 [Dethiobacter sp.]|jgi:hypothetical protein|nr:hypothetical protein [Dethiobacter sp.]MBS3901104.1 hypothetical protein [Dethiobacter sp.]MBS3990018.1 hypothetical protein [Dethiobacter sp.]
MTKNTPITKDWLMMGIATGVAGTLAKDLFNYGLYKKNIPTVRYASIASGTILGKRATFGIIPKKAKTRGELALGLVADIILASFFGTTLTHLIIKSPPGNEIIKGIAGGGILWATTLGFGNLLAIDGLARIKPNQMASLLGSSALFGGVQGYFLGKYREKMIEQSYPIMVQETSDLQFRKKRMAKKRDEQLP